MRLSQRIHAVAPSATIAISARARQMQAEGKDVISFGAGEPDFDTPAFIKEAAKAALDAGDVKYQARRGAELVAAIVSKLARENGLHVTAEQVAVTFGGKHALYAAFQALLDPGDRVLLPAPYWTSYPEQIRLAGGEPVVLPAGPEVGFKITPDQIRQAADGARALLLSYPANPTGASYTRDELDALAAAVLQTDLVVFSDEVYEKLLFGGATFTSFAALDERLPERTVTFNSVSKTFAMPGWRLGWAACPADLIAAIARLRSHETTNPPGFVQAAALAAYTDPSAAEASEAMRADFEARAAHMTERLNALDGVSCVPPSGGLYCFPDVSSHYGRTLGGVEVAGSLDFARAALAGVGVALVPGAAFGEDRCVRLTFATARDQIDAGIDRLAKLLAG